MEREIDELQLIFKWVVLGQDCGGYSIPLEEASRPSESEELRSRSFFAVIVPYPANRILTPSLEESVLTVGNS